MVRTIVQIGLHIFEADVDVCEVDNEASYSFQLIASSDNLLLCTPLRFRYKCKVSDN
jgi:NAD(P)H-dependent FMN reductase